MDHVVDEVHVEDKAPEAPFEEDKDVQGGWDLFGLVWIIDDIMVLILKSRKCPFLTMGL